MKDVLLLRPDKAGDAIKTLPALRTLRKYLPGIQLHVLVSPHNFSLFVYEPGVRVFKLGSKLPQFDIAVNLLCDHFSDVEKLLESIDAKEKYSIRKALQLPGGSAAGRDETENIALLLEQVFKIPLVPHLAEVSRIPALCEDDAEEAERVMGLKSGRWLGFCPFAGTTQRTHPLKKWEGFFPQATEDGSYERYFIFGAKSDRENLEKLKALSTNRSKVVICYPSSFRTLGSYLKRLDAVVAVDSGPLHYAQALGVRSLGILSGGDAKRWFSKLSSQDQILKRGFFNRYPSVWEMLRAFRRWQSA